MLVEKHLEHQKKLFHSFIDFKKAFDRVRREYNIDNRLIEVIRSLLYAEAASAVLLNGNVLYFFQATVGVRQGCPLYPVLFNLFLEKIMHKVLTPQHSSENDCYAGDALKEAKGTDSVHRRTTTLQHALCRRHRSERQARKTATMH